MVSCCVGNCAVTRKNNAENYTFHRVPHNPIRREKWIRIINRPDWKPYKNSYVCSKHFEEQCFIQREHRRFLMKDSIPTLFVPIQLKGRRPVSVYVNRDLMETASHADPRPGSSSEALSPTKKRLIKRNARLKALIVQKNKLLRNLRAKANRMSKRILTLEEIVRDLKNRLGLENHENDVEIYAREGLVV